jgi:hypothetical protein
MAQLSQQRTPTPQLHPMWPPSCRHLNQTLRSPILDLGSGSRALLERLTGMGYQQLTGVDIPPPAS